MDDWATRLDEVLRSLDERGPFGRDEAFAGGVRPLLDRILETAPREAGDKTQAREILARVREVALRLGDSARAARAFDAASQLGLGWPCKAGSAEGKIHWMAPDFDAPLEDFREYME